MRRVKVFWQSAKGHLYGRFPEWMRRCRARELESLNGYEDFQRNTHQHVECAYFAAPLTHVWLLARVNSHMYSQSRALYERLVAPFLWADVGSVATVYSFYNIIILATEPKITINCTYHDEQDHSFVQTLCHKCCMQKLLHFHCCFAASYQSLQDQLRADHIVGAAVANIHFGRVAPHSLLAVLAFFVATVRQDCSSRPAPCAA